MRCRRYEQGIRVVRGVAGVLVTGLLLILPGTTSAQQRSWDPAPDAAPAGDDVAEAIRRYRDQRLSSGYYEPRDLGPTFHLRYGPVEGRTYRRLASRADAHAGVKGYGYRPCVACHEREAVNAHTIRGNNTCRQCHGAEPISSVDYYFSPMNSIRRHAYVCAKCHEGASASFATYVVHEPVANTVETRQFFPALYYSDRFMFWLIVGVFALFIPHSVAWFVREWFVRRKQAQ